ncbi:MAG: HK97 family phage prohead protease [Solirubrobacterales bacterium]
MRSKNIELVEAKADDAGQFTALAAVFGNIDNQGDRVMPGAFSETLRKWRDSGDEIPVIFSHQAQDLFAWIGTADPNDIRETAQGLVVNGKLDVTDNPTARQVAKLMKRGNLKGWSYGYTVPAGGETIAEDGANDLHRIDLIEVGPTLRGANREARTLAVKSMDDLPDRCRLRSLDELAARRKSSAPVRVAEYAID